MRVVGVLGLGLLDVDAAVLRADDPGLTRGDGCFEGCRIRRGRVDKLDAHLARMRRSADALEIPFDDAAWRDLIALVGAAVSSVGEAALKLVLTRGHDGVPSGLATVTDVDVTAVRRDGISVITLDRGVSSSAFTDAPWLLGGVKTLSYAVNMAAYREAERRGVDDVLFISTDGHVLEAPTSTAVWAVQDTLHTTPTGATGILGGTTQQLLFERATDWKRVETLATPAELTAADGLWLISSVRGPVEVRRLDGTARAATPELTAELRRLTDF